MMYMISSIPSSNLRRDISLVTVNKNCVSRGISLPSSPNFQAIHHNLNLKHSKNCMSLSIPKEITWMLSCLSKIAPRNTPSSGLNDDFDVSITFSRTSVRTIQSFMMRFSLEIQTTYLVVFSPCFFLSILS